MLVAKLEIQSEFTQIAYLGGENGELSLWARPEVLDRHSVINAARAAENKPVYRSIFS